MIDLRSPLFSIADTQLHKNLITVKKQMQERTQTSSLPNLQPQQNKITEPLAAFSYNLTYNSFKSNDMIATLKVPQIAKKRQVSTFVREKYNCRVYLSVLNNNATLKQNFNGIQDEIRTLKLLSETKAPKKRLGSKQDSLFVEFVEYTKRRQFDFNDTDQQNQLNRLKSFHSSGSMNDSQVLESEESPSNNGRKRGMGNLGEQWNKWYYTRFMEQITKLKDLLKLLLQNIMDMRQLWQNEERVQRFLKKQLINKDELNKIFFSQGRALPPDIALRDFIKLFQESSMQYHDKQSVQIYKYNFKHSFELNELNKNISSVLHNSEVNRLKQLKQSIQAELNQVKKKETNYLISISSKLQNQKHKFDQQNMLSYFNPWMHNDNRVYLTIIKKQKDLSLQRVERVYQSLERPSGEVRDMNVQLKDVLVHLYESSSKI